MLSKYHEHDARALHSMAIASKYPLLQRGREGASYRVISSIAGLSRCSREGGVKRDFQESCCGQTTCFLSSSSTITTSTTSTSTSTSTHHQPLFHLTYSFKSTTSCTTSHTHTLTRLVALPLTSPLAAAADSTHKHVADGEGQYCHSEDLGAH